jgi:Tfp pilus assembly protein FimT
MEYRGQNGFTVIEVLMFLGISGLLLIGAFAAVNSSIDNTRFNDAINSTTSFLQGEYATISSGRNSRSASLGCSGGVINGTASTAGMTNCIVLGRLIEFGVGGSAVTSRYIVGRDVVSFTGTDTAAIQSANPVIINDSAASQNFTVPWTIEIDRMTTSGLSVNHVAMIRSPISERILLYSFQAPSNPTLDSSRISEANLNRPIDVCFLDGGGINARAGFIRIGAGQGQDVIRKDLSTNPGSCS